MKKIISLFSVFLLVLCSFSSFYALKNKDSEKWRQLFNLQNSVYVNVHDTHMSNMQIYEHIKEISDAYDANVIKLNYAWDNQQLIVNYGLYLNQDINYDFKLRSGNIITHENTHESIALSTKNLHSSEQIGLLDDFMQDDHIIIATLQYFSNQDTTMEGDYYFCNISSTKEALLEDLAIAFNCSVEDLSVQTNFLNTSVNGYENIFNLAKWLCFVLMFVINIYYFCSQLSSVGILKINGYSNLDIWLFIFRKPLYLQVIISLLIQLVYSFLLIEIPIDYYLLLTLDNGLYLLLCVMTSLILVGLIKNYSICYLLKKVNYNSILNKLNFLFRFSFLSLMSCVLALFVVHIDQYTQMYQIMKPWDEYKDFLVVNYYENTLSEYYINQDEHEQQTQLRDYYHLLNSLGSFYITTTTRQAEDYAFAFDQDEILPNVNYTLMTINPNYLQQLNLFDLSQQEIVIDDEAEEIYILIPASKVDMEDEIYELEKHILDFEDSDETHSSPNINVSFYDDINNNSFFSFNKEIQENSGFRVPSPVFMVVSEYVITDMQLFDCSVTGLDSALKIPMLQLGISDENGMAHFQQQVHQVFDYLGEPVYYQIGNIFQEEIALIKAGVIQTIMILLLIFVLYLLVSGLAIRLYLELNVKRIAILKFNGYSFFHRFKGFFSSLAFTEIMILIIYIICVMLWSDYYKDMSSFPYNPSLFIFFCCIPIIILDCFYLLIAIKRYENAKIVNYLKGDNYGHH